MAEPGWRTSEFDWDSLALAAQRRRGEPGNDELCCQASGSRAAAVTAPLRHAWGPNIGGWPSAVHEPELTGAGWQLLPLTAALWQHLPAARGDSQPASQEGWMMIKAALQYGSLDIPQAPLCT